MVHWQLDEKGWRFPTSSEIAEYGTSVGTEDHLYGSQRLSELYLKAEPNYKGKFSVPLLWDSKEKTIVSNQSADIVRMLNSEFNGLLEEPFAKVDLYPEGLREQINGFNQCIKGHLNDGVYNAGLAKEQKVYEEYVQDVFSHLDMLEGVLQSNLQGSPDNVFLTGAQLAELDIWLFPTIVRFDVVYHQHFKCNMKMLRHDYPHIQKWLQNLYWNVPGFKETTHFDHIKKFYASNRELNPHGITPLGPVPDMLPL